MVLNYIWLAFFLLAFVIALVQTLFQGNLGIWTEVVNASFTSAKTAFEISLGLTGVLALWMGLMKIGERSGIVGFFARIISPLFCRLFPDLPKNHPALGSIFMNISANMLGLDNAATPLGLKAMREMQAVNPNKDTASNPMIMFLMLNTSGLVLIPITIMMYRAQMGAANPADVFIPILIATFFATLIGLIFVCIKQGIKLYDKVIVSWIGGMALFICGIIAFFAQLPQEKISLYSSFGANFILFSIIVGFLVSGLRKRINVYETFIEGAKEGFTTAITIIPYLVAMLVGIAVFRASGAMTFLTDVIGAFVAFIGLDTEFVGAIPTALMKPLSGSGSRGMMIDVMTTYGADSFVSRVAATIQGSTDTTFYILAVYFGSVGIRNTRYAVTAGLLADFTGAVAGILTAYFFFR